MQKDVDAGRVELLHLREIKDELRHKLAREAFALTADYDAAIESYLVKVKG